MLVVLAVEEASHGGCQSMAVNENVHLPSGKQELLLVLTRRRSFGKAGCVPTLEFVWSRPPCVHSADYTDEILAFGRVSMLASGHLLLH